MFFNAKREEAGAISQFRRNCVRTGMTIELSERALNTLRRVVEAQATEEDVDITDQDAGVLLRRGFIRASSNFYVVTELGLLMVAFAEAAGLISLKGNAKAIKTAA
jgi:hypothetical protein